jgi:hypothetical protein
LIEQGDWVDSIPNMPGIRIKARGINNRDYRMLEAKLIREISDADRIDGLKPEVLDRIAGRCLLETVVLDIEGFTEDDEKTPIKYTRELGEQLLLDPDYQEVRAAAAYAGGVVAKRRKTAEETDVKN